MYATTLRRSVPPCPRDPPLRAHYVCPRGSAHAAADAKCGCIRMLFIHLAIAGQVPPDNLDLLWPTPLLKTIDPIAQAANGALKKLLVRLSKTERGVSKTNLGGWQSDIDLFERSEPEITVLRTRTYHAVFRYLQSMAPSGSEGRFEVSIGSAWANLNNRTHGNSPHMHPGVQLSGVYYVDDGGSRMGGIRLIDPRAQASMVPVPSMWTLGMGEHIRVQAVPGLFVLFPSWLNHYVRAPRMHEHPLSHVRCAHCSWRVCFFRARAGRGA